jgi:hypothetical protein
MKALVASRRSLSNTCQFSLQSHEARLTVGKAKILGVRLTKRLSKYLKIQMRHTHRFTSDLSSWSSREVHQDNERVLRMSNKIAQKTSSFYFTLVNGHVQRTSLRSIFFFKHLLDQSLVIYSMLKVFSYKIEYFQTSIKYWNLLLMNDGWNHIYYIKSTSQPVLPLCSRD